MDSSNRLNKPLSRRSFIEEALAVSVVLATATAPNALARIVVPAMGRPDGKTEIDLWTGWSRSAVERMQQLLANSGKLSLPEANSRGVRSDRSMQQRIAELAEKYTHGISTVSW